MVGGEAGIHGSGVEWHVGRDYERGGGHVTRPAPSLVGKRVPGLTARQRRAIVDPVQVIKAEKTVCFVV